MSAMYYLSRGATPEGPFEEARLVHLIQSGEVTQGGICPVGQNQWLPLNAVPSFAQALAMRAAPPPHGTAPGYGAPPAQAYGPPPGPAQPPQYGQPPGAPGGYGPPAGYGQPPGPAGYGQPPAQAAYAAPAPGYGAHPGYGQPGAGPAKKSRALLFAAIGGGALLLIVGIAVAAYALVFSSGGAPSIAKSVPKDCEFLIEVPSARQLVSDLHDVRFLDTTLRDDKKVFDDSADALSKAFDISTADALTLLAATETFGISGRKLATDPEFVIALGMKLASPVETLLKSARFVSAGTLGKGGKRYTLTSKEVSGTGAAAKALGSAQFRAGGKETLVWFPDSRLFVMGTEQLVADLAQVVESGAQAITENPSYQAAAKDFESGARVTAFLDPVVFSTIAEPKVKELVDGYFKPAGPLTGSLQVKPAGFVTSLTGRFSGAKLPRATAYEGPQALDLAQRLPQETFAYLAFSTHTKLTGAETEKQLFDQLSAVEPAGRAQIEQGLRQMEALLGVTAVKLVDGIGGQSVLGLSATAGTTLDTLGLGAQAAAHFNLTWVVELKDEAEFKKLAAQLKAKLLPSFREVVVVSEGDGFSVTARGVPLPVSMRVKFLDKHLFVTAGSNALCDRAEAAFSKGERTLKDDAAHKSALGALPSKQHLLLWIDSGRIADTLVKDARVHAQLNESGLSIDKVTLTGDERVTSALAMSGEVKDDVWTYRLDTLNMQALAPLGVGGSALAGGMRLPGL
jgi:hypothetical protein